MNENGVEYLIGGAFALAHHGRPRYTGAIDIWVRPVADAAARVLQSVKQFGFSFPNLTQKDFVHPERVIQLGVPPHRIDLLTSLDGLTWAEAWAGRDEGKYGDLPVWFLGRAEFLKNKRATGRLKDLGDIEALEGIDGGTAG